MTYEGTAIFYVIQIGNSITLYENNENFYKNVIF